jgi:hypothetical protein
MASLNHL